MYQILYFLLVPNIRPTLSLIFKTQPKLNGGLEFVGIFSVDFEDFKFFKKYFFFHFHFQKHALFISASHIAIHIAQGA